MSAATEEWRPVVGREGQYEVSSLGNIRHTHTLHPVSIIIDRDREVVRLSNPTKVTTHRRIVADAFVPFLSDNIRVIEHLNGDPNDCRAENLAWKKQEPDMPGEKWRAVSGCGVYLVSNMGRVKNNRSKQLVRSYDSDCGYRVVPLTIKDEHGSYRKANCRIHRLVAEAFMPDHDPHCTVIRHLNGIRTDDRAENLAWEMPIGKRKGELRPYYDAPVGSSQGNSKLLESEVVMIRQMFRTGTPLGLLASMFGVTQGAVRSIVYGKIWGHVPS